jgi:hypothetical protein
VLVEIQELDRLELERAFRDVDKFLQERHYLVASTKTPGMTFFSGLMPGDCVGERAPTASQSRRLRAA